MMQTREHFERRLAELPAPGTGQGFHAGLLGVANLGKRAGLTDTEVAETIRQGIKTGNREVPDKEIRDAIEKAQGSCDWKPSGENYRPPKPKITRDAFSKLTSQSDLGPDPESEFWERGLHIECEPEEVSAIVLPMLFRENELVYIADTGNAPGILGQTIRPCGEWVRLFSQGMRPPEYFIINPLTGAEGRTKTGAASYRCDSTVAAHRHVLVEFDQEPIEEQLAFYSRSKLRIATITHSAGKSAHALLRVNAPDGPAWLEIVRRLYAHLEPLGADSANKNPSRLSRLPGGYRQGKGWQRVIYINPEVLHV